MESVSTGMGRKAAKHMAAIAATTMAPAIPKTFLFAFSLPAHAAEEGEVAVPHLGQNAASPSSAAPHFLQRYAFDCAFASLRTGRLSGPSA